MTNEYWFAPKTQLFTGRLNLIGQQRPGYVQDAADNLSIAEQEVDRLNDIFDDCEDNAIRAELLGALKVARQREEDSRELFFQACDVWHSEVPVDLSHVINNTSLPAAVL